MATPQHEPPSRAPIPFVQVRTPELVQRVTPAGLWLPSTALAVSMALAASAGMTLGVLVALQASIAADRWTAVVQAHAMVQLWGWFAVSIAALVFEFIVRLNRHPALPVAPRAGTLLLFVAGSVVAAAGGVLGRAEQPLALAGWTLVVAGTTGFLILVLRVPPGRPMRVDLHPLFFRTGAVWVAVSALLGLLGASRISSGVIAPPEFDALTEVFLRGFVMNIVVAVGLRAFPGHLGLPPVDVRGQRVLLLLLNIAVLLGLASTRSFGLPGLESVARLADLGFAAAIAWATYTFRIWHAVRAWGARSERPQVMVPVAWAGLLAYGALLATQAVAQFLGGMSTPVMASGGARHVFMLGFVAPLLVAMIHVVLERFGTGHVVSRNWLTVSFMLMVIAWPLRSAPPLLDPATGAMTRGTMGVAGLLVAVALLLASIAAARNALQVVGFARQFARAG